MVNAVMTFDLVPFFSPDILTRRRVDDLSTGLETFAGRNKGKKLFQ